MAAVCTVQRQSPLCYTLTYKRVKRLNLRVKPDGSVHVSVPLRTPQRKIDAFMHSRLDWIQSAQARMRARAYRSPDLLPILSDEACMAIFAPVIARTRACTAPYTLPSPSFKLRTMKSCWGTCHTQKHVITLNRALAQAPLPAIEYVILHEFLHLKYPDHGAGFHAALCALMPDYAARRAQLKALLNAAHPHTP